jgi:hypothetical protein
MIKHIAKRDRSASAPISEIFATPDPKRKKRTVRHSGSSCYVRSPTNQSPPNISTRYLFENSYLGPPAPKKTQPDPFTHRISPKIKPIISRVVRNLRSWPTKNRKFETKIPRINSGPRRSSFLTKTFLVIDFSRQGRLFGYV